MKLICRSLFLILAMSSLAARACEEALAAKELKRLLEQTANASSSERATRSRLMAARLAETRAHFLSQLGGLSDAEKNRAWQAFVENLGLRQKLEVKSGSSRNSQSPEEQISSLPKLTEIVKAIVWNGDESAVAVHFANGYVKCFGNAHKGGHCDTLAGLKFKSIVVADDLFLALRDDGQLHCWGSRWDQYGCQGMENVQSVTTTAYAFAALKKDGTVQCGGRREWGGDCSELKVPNIVSVVASEKIFVALTKEGSLYAWGEAKKDGTLKAPEKIPSPVPVRSVVAGSTHFSAIRTDGRVQHFRPYWSFSEEIPDLEGVTSITATQLSFAALKADGTVHCWGQGDEPNCGDPDLNEVQEIRATKQSFIALRRNGDLQCWGELHIAKWCQTVKNVASITTNKFAAVALRKDGSLSCWGMVDWGGECSQEPGLKNIVGVLPIGRAFLAEKADGTVATWIEEDLVGVATKQIQGVIEQAYDSREAAMLAEKIRSFRHP